MENEKLKNTIHQQASNVLEQTNISQAMHDKKAALAAIKNKFISTTIKVYVNSIGREVNFREITVAEQKQLARIMIDNENRKDIVYDAQCAVLKSICLEDDFDIYSVTEFDKIKLLLLLYQRNMIKHEISFVCPECNTENKYQIDFSNVINKLDKFDMSDKEFSYENLSWKFKFKLAYPKVSKVSQFYSSRYLNMKKTNDKKILDALNNSINVDYTNLFIKNIEFIDKSTNDRNNIDVNDYSLDEFFELISVFPQDVLYSDNGLIQFITSEFIAKINDAFEKHECFVCGKLCESTSDSSAEGFF